MSVVFHFFYLNSANQICTLQINVKEEIESAARKGIHKVLTVRPPYLLQYRRESEGKGPDYNNLKVGFMIIRILLKITCHDRRNRNKDFPKDFPGIYVLVAINVVRTSF